MRMRLLLHVSGRLFYNPYRAVAKSENIRMGRSQLGRDFRVRFNRPHEGVALEIGDGCVLSNEFIFESSGGKVTVGDGVFINGGTKVISRSSMVGA